MRRASWRPPTFDLLVSENGKHAAFRFCTKSPKTTLVLSFSFSFFSPERPPELTSVFTDQIKLSSSSGKSSSNRQQSSADSLSLRCSATGVPLPSIRWHLDGQELYSSSHVRIDSFTESSAVAPSLGSSMLGGPQQQQGNSAALKAYHLSRSVTSYLNISSLLVQVNKTKQILVRGLEF